MSSPAPKLATYQALSGLAEDVRAEVVKGQVTVSPAPLPMHARAQRALGRYIGGPFDDDDGRGGPGGWWILPEVDVRLGEHDIVRPDVAGWRRERLPSPWNTRPIDVVPDWICEILSPSNVAHDRVTKARLYAHYGLPCLWLLDPAERTLEVFSLTDEHWTCLGSYDDTATARLVPFDAIEVSVAAFLPPRPAP